MPEKTTLGFMMKNLVSLVKKRKGESGLTQLKSKFNDITFSSQKRYPVTLEKTVINESCKILYGIISSHNLFLLGKDMLTEELMNNILGKTVMIFIQKGDLKQKMLKLPNILNTLKLSEFKLEIIDLGEDKAIKAYLRNSTLDINFMGGFFAGAIETFRHKPLITYKIIEPECYEFNVKWE